ncbi:FAD-dependent oxidoreductase [Woeseia oceani]|uniref:D-amino-acid oxidase n=1 Tax=Woeseia oceani TaxID=1548547 RepID=A0A193LI35_9GAMM|nr:FAD-dependent oxidoreductase [Woeseia oceani]ANO52054.1 hypothetical protein BA177_13365 [Woeseia oceani]
MTSRRTLLQSLAALPLVGACAGPRISSQQNYTPSGLPLHRVLVSPDRVVRVVTGLRPYRPTGFVVRAEKLGDKAIIHNYGHGGGGITLSWGTSHMALELAMQSEQRRCAVLGCGAVGLASARLLQRHGWDVTIYARDLPPETTSNIAGAQWSPASLYDDGFDDPRFFNDLGIAMRHSYREFQHLVGRHYGVSWVSNYVLSDQPPTGGDIHSRYPDMFPERRALTAMQHPFPAKHGLHFDTMFIEPPVYLPAIMHDYHAAGGKITIRNFQDKQELLTLDEQVIINCTGLGSRNLFDDQDLIPVKGQLVVLKPQADINYLMIKRGIYMFPRQDGVLLGGTFEKNEWSLTPDPAATARILREHAAFFREMDDPWASPWDSSAA